MKHDSKEDAVDVDMPPADRCSIQLKRLRCCRCGCTVNHLPPVALVAHANRFVESQLLDESSIRTAPLADDVTTGSTVVLPADQHAVQQRTADHAVGDGLIQHPPYHRVLP